MSNRISHLILQMQNAFINENSFKT